MQDRRFPVAGGCASCLGGSPPHSGMQCGWFVVRRLPDRKVSCRMGECRYKNNKKYRKYRKYRKYNVCMEISRFTAALRPDIPQESVRTMSRATHEGGRCEPETEPMKAKAPATPPP